MNSHAVVRLDVNNPDLDTADVYDLPSAEEGRRLRLEIVVRTVAGATIQINLGQGEPVRPATLLHGVAEARSHLILGDRHQEGFMIIVPGLNAWFVTALSGLLSIDS